MNLHEFMNTSTLQGRRRVEDVPNGLVARVAVGRNSVGDLDEFVTYDRKSNRPIRRNASLMNANSTAVQSANRMQCFTNAIKSRTFVSDDPLTR